MSDFKNLKEEWIKGYEESKENGEAVSYLTATILISLGSFLITLAVMGLAFLFVKAILPYLIVAGVVYGLGVHFRGWPIPSFLKKFIK